MMVARDGHAARLGDLLARGATLAEDAAQTLAGASAAMAGAMPGFAAAIRQAEAEQRAALLAGRDVLPVEVRVCLDSLMRPAADALVLAFAALHNARGQYLGDAERGLRLGYCRGLIDGAAQRRELEHGEFVVLNSYALRLAAEAQP